MEQLWQFPCEKIRVIDGDTVVLVLDLGLGIKVTRTLRLLGIQAPEKHGETRAAGVAAQFHLWGLFSDYPSTHVFTHKDKSDSWGRFLAEIIGENAAGEVVNFSRRMIESGHAKEYR